MAADSASSFANGMIYHNSRKIVHLLEGIPVASMVTGAGGIGNESVVTLLKNLEQRFAGTIPTHQECAVNPSTYTVGEIAVRLREFLFEEKSVSHGATTWTKIRVCGYSSGRPLPEIWEVNMNGRHAPAVVHTK